jgi:hypothetical protein
LIVLLIFQTISYNHEERLRVRKPVYGQE